jgi:hypothetical protein
VAEFTVSDSVERVKVVLASYSRGEYVCGKAETYSDTCRGNIYVDDIKIEPALEARYNIAGSASCIEYSCDGTYGCGGAGGCESTWNFIGAAGPGPSCDEGEVTSEEYSSVTGDLIGFQCKTDEASGNFKVDQTCRLYPQDDSLSCEYYEDSGKKQKGQYGYCLEYDRSPGNSDACLLWWPVDMVQGQGIHEGAGYIGPVPVYYCTEYTKEFNVASLSAWKGSKATIEAEDIGIHNYPKDLLDNRLSFYVVETGDGTDEFPEPDAPMVIGSNNGWSLGWCGGEDGDADNCPGPYGTNNSYPDPYPENPAPCRKDRVEANIPYSDVNTNITSEDGKEWVGIKANFDEDELLDNITLKIGGDSVQDAALSIEAEVPYVYCSRLTQTVTHTGRNKYWSGRVYEGSDFKIVCDDITKGADGSINDVCEYKTLNKPFGSIRPEEPIYNPFEWDFRDDMEGKYPIEYTPVEGGLTFKAVYEKDNLRRLFSQSYGTWEWDGNHYVPVEGHDWLPEDTNCGGERPDYEPPSEFFHVDGTAPDGSSVDMDLPATFVTPESASDFYGYSDANFNNDDFVGMIAGDTSNVFVHYSSGTNKFSIGMIHDCPEDTYSCDDSDSENEVEFSFSSVTDGAQAVVSDDGGEFAGYNNSGKTDFNSSHVGDWWYNENNTDGGMIEMPIEEEWNVTIIPDLFDGISTWRIAYKEDGGFAFQQLDLNEPVTISRGTTEGEDDDLCGIPPEVENVKINGEQGGIEINRANFVNLEFNTLVNSQQLPLTTIHIDWGDGNTTVISGAEMRDKANEDDPHSFYHLYSYQDLKAKGMSTDLKPKIKIKDNWGWCNGDNTRGDCNSWESYPGIISVDE